MVGRGLTATADLWADIRTAYAWVHRAAHILANAEEHVADAVRREYNELLAEMARDRDCAGTLSSAISYFLKVTRSYEPGLYHCYEVPELPRTNNDLEHYFGSARYQERRATGRKGASPALVVRGSVRMIASVATQLHPFTATDIRPDDPESWRDLRRKLDARHEVRRAQLRFRKEPTAYLAQLEAQLLKPSLPP
jgi:hypothetical protein